MMDAAVERLIIELESTIRNPNFMESSAEIVEQLRSNLSGFEAVEPILRVMENNPDADFGVPGPLVHFLETFYRRGYEEKLLESLSRHPTAHTVWMLNRIINGTKGQNQLPYLSALDDIILRTDISSDLRAQATEFRSLH
jgi:hypothetical protein